MDGEDKFYLPAGAEVYLKSEKNNLERLLSIAYSDDISNEIRIIKKIGDFPPFSLFVYEDVLGWGRYFRRNGGVDLSLIDYSDNMFTDWIDLSFSYNKSGIRIIKKMSNEKEFSRRLELRTKYNWIDFNSDTEIMEESFKVGCEIQKALNADFSNPPRKNMYTLFEDRKEVIVNHFKIEEVGKLGGGKTAYACFTDSKRLNFPPDLVEEMILVDDPDALIVKEPLLCCSHSIVKLPPCVASFFIKDYLRKTNKKEVPPNSGPVQFYEN